jgi:hypothetical protein
MAVSQSLWKEDLIMVFIGLEIMFRETANLEMK